MTEDPQGVAPESAEDQAPPAKAVCAITLIVLPGGGGVQIQTAQAGPNFERAATALDIRGACTEVLQMLQSQMTASSLVQLQAKIEADAQAQAAVEAELARAQRSNGHPFFRKRG